MNITEDTLIDPASAPYSKMRSWMPALASKVKLSKEDLSTFALLFEVAHPDGVDTDRITMQYLCECTGLDASGAFESIQRLMRKELATFKMSGASGDFLGNFTIDEEGVARELAQVAADVKPERKKTKEPNKE